LSVSLSCADACYVAAGRCVLDRVSLSVDPGLLHALIGPNGAGKSTLVSLLAGDRTPARGAVSLEGRALSQWPRAQLARRRAVMLQSEHLPFAFTALDVVALGRLPWHEAPARERDIARQALAATGLEQLAARPYPQLSGGERARVQLARALAQIWTRDEQAPRYLLLDEPTAHLDFAFVHDCLRRVRRLADEGVGVLLTVQDPNLALIYADHVSLLADGRIQASGAPPAVLTPEALQALYGIELEQLRDGRRSLLVARAARTV
jgi:iron complex transport system ATP-binding protein